METPNISGIKKPASLQQTKKSNPLQAEKSKIERKDQLSFSTEALANTKKQESWVALLKAMPETREIASHKEIHTSKEAIAMTARKMLDELLP
jgi:hypothetical protein